MRVFIVGVHNKTGLPPLDSSTKSGKLIDRIEIGLSMNVERTNLFNTDYLPPKQERQTLSKEWFKKYMPTSNDVVVLLGSIVHKEFKHKIDKLIKIKHPASQWSNKDMSKYVRYAVIKIKQLGRLESKPKRVKFKAKHDDIYFKGVNQLEKGEAIDINTLGK